MTSKKNNIEEKIKNRRPQARRTTPTRRKKKGNKTQKNKRVEA